MSHVATVARAEVASDARSPFGNDDPSVAAQLPLAFSPGRGPLCTVTPPADSDPWGPGTVELRLNFSRVNSTVLRNATVTGAIDPALGATGPGDVPSKPHCAV